MSGPEYHGGCMCGAVRYVASGEARNLCYCHCASCRRAAGAPGVPWATFASSNLRISGTLSEYRSSAQVLRGFCSTCGTSLTYRSERRPQDTDVTLGSLDEPARLAPAMRVWVAERLPWEVRDQLPAHAGGGDS
jgi:hypothetical protein